MRTLVCLPLLGLFALSLRAAEPPLAASAPAPQIIVLWQSAPGAPLTPVQATVVPAQLPYPPAPAVVSTPIVSSSTKDQKKAEHRAKLAYHRYEPDGCPTPVGCGNFYSEFKFVFGSCRQFFGTGDSTEGHCHKTVVPPPGPVEERAASVRQKFFR